MEIAVSFTEVLRFFKKAWYRILIAIALFAVLFSLTAGVLQKPVYLSQASILISCEYHEEEDAEAKVQYVNILNARIRTAVAFASSKNVLDRAIKEVGYRDKASELIESLDVNQVNDSQIINVRVRGKTPEVNANIANKVAEITAIEIGNQFVNPPTYGLVWDKAAAAEEASPHTAMVKAAMVGGLFGAFLSVAVSVVLLILNKKVTNPAFAAEKLEIQHLATVKRRKKGSNQESAIRLLRARLFRRFQRGIFMITCPAEDDAERTAASLLADDMAVSGKKVLLVHALAADGAGSVTIEDILHAPEKAAALPYQENRPLMLSVSNDAEKIPHILEQGCFSDCIRTLAEFFDYIIINVSPVKTNTDAISIAHLSDATILTVKYGITEYGLLKKAVATLRVLGGSMLGFLFYDG